MLQNLIAGFVVVALIVMGVLAYAQKHEGCLHGRSLETFKPCGTMSPDYSAAATLRLTSRDLD
jgi:hypothetical protein